MSSVEQGEKLTVDATPTGARVGRRPSSDDGVPGPVNMPFGSTLGVRRAKNVFSGAHVSDAMLFAPVFCEGSELPDVYLAVRAHWMECRS